MNYKFGKKTLIPILAGILCLSLVLVLLTGGKDYKPLSRKEYQQIGDTFRSLVQAKESFDMHGESFSWDDFRLSQPYMYVNRNSSGVILLFYRETCRGFITFGRHAETGEFKVAQIRFDDDVTLVTPVEDSELPPLDPLSDCCRKQTPFALFQDSENQIWLVTDGDSVPVITTCRRPELKAEIRGEVFSKETLHLSKLFD